MSWEGTHNEDYVQVFKYMDPYLFAYVGIGLVLGLSVLGAAWVRLFKYLKILFMNLSPFLSFPPLTNPPTQPHHTTFKITPPPPLLLLTQRYQFFFEIIYMNITPHIINHRVCF